MSDRFEIRDAPLQGLKLIERKVVVDDRGFVERLFGAEELRAVIGDRAVAQVNRTLTLRRGTVRDMHYQRPPHAEFKFVTCLKGSVFDVSVDIRRNSPTFLEWHAELLSDSEQTTVFIPEGFAHGFQALTDNCELLYFHSAAYEPASEGAVNARDPMLAIRWPQDITAMSARDASHPMLTPDYTGVET